MSKPLEVGDRVLCQWFNSPEGKFYGDLWEATIIDIQPGRTEPGAVWYIKHEKPICVQNEHHPGGVWMKRKEIKQRIG